MRELFLDMLAGARARGRVAAARVWCLAAWDLARARLHAIVQAPARRGAVSSRKASAHARHRLEVYVPVARAPEALDGARRRHADARHRAPTSSSSAWSTGCSCGRSPSPSRIASSTSTRRRRAGTSRSSASTIPTSCSGARAPDSSTAIALYDGDSFNLSDGAGAERIEGATVTYDFATVLGVRPILGRSFTAEEDRPNAARVVVINESVWRDRFKRRAGRARPHAQAERRGAHDRRRHARGHPLSRQRAGVGAVCRRSGADVSELRRQRHRPAEAGRHRRRTPRRICCARTSRSGTRATRSAPSRRSRDPLRDELVRDFRTQARTLARRGRASCSSSPAPTSPASCSRGRSRAGGKWASGSRSAPAGRGSLRQLFVENVVLAALGGALGLLAGHWALRAPDHERRRSDPVVGGLRLRRARRRVLRSA